MKVRVNANQENEKNILTLLEELGYSLPCNCHGAHLCNGHNYPFDCSMIPTSPVEVELPVTSKQIHSIALEELTPSKGLADTLLIDLGTTTIALALIQQKSGELRQTSVSANPQTRYGSDVIARIQAASGGSLAELHSCIRKHLEQEVRLLCERNHQKTSELKLCYIGGNTTMIHLLMGYDCSSLGRSPFTIQIPSPEPFYHHSCRVIIAPWISAFVGGDITAGLSACGMSDRHTASLFVDLGTNGEMVLYHRGTYYTAATAAGPALEGNGLSCGCPGIPGAIRNVRLRRLHPVLDTIGNQLPIGLCGSGAISLCAELLRRQYITTDGILTAQFPKQGIFLARNPQGNSLCFTPEDLRNVQLAMAAIAAGIDTLLQTAKLSPSDVTKLYLGGGFGFHLDLNDCAILGLFSRIPVSRIEVMGNTCLRGLYQQAASGILPTIPTACISLNLAESAAFQEQFIKHMTFCP